MENEMSLTQRFSTSRAARALGGAFFLAGGLAACAPVTPDENAVIWGGAAAGGAGLATQGMDSTTRVIITGAAGAVGAAYGRARGAAAGYCDETINTQEDLTKKGRNRIKRADRGNACKRSTAHPGGGIDWGALLPN